MNSHNKFKQNNILKKYNVPNNILIIYGLHSCLSALYNKKREKLLILTNKKNFKFWLNQVKKIKSNLKVVPVDEQELNAISNNNVHQNVLLFSYPLKKITLDSYLKAKSNLKNKIILLDQVTDPQNVGSIIRSAFAFHFNAVGFLKNHAARETPSMIKASSGEIEKVTLIELKNLSNEIRLLKDNGFYVYGLSNDKKINLKKLTVNHDKIALVLGSENNGLRELTKKSVDGILYIPINEQCDSLNASNAAAIAMYQLSF